MKVAQIYTGLSLGISESQLRQRLEAVLQDELRSGTRVKFTVEQIVEIVALACELPASSGRPISHWSPGELASQALKRGNASADFAPQCGAFFKRKSPSNLTG